MFNLSSESRDGGFLFFVSSQLGGGAWLLPKLCKVRNFGHEPIYKILYMTPTNMKIYMQKRRWERREKLLDLSERICKNCGSIENLEFDHRDRTTKKFTLSGCALDKSWDEILLEHEKCDLLCNECHKIR